MNINNWVDLVTLTFTASTPNKDDSMLVDQVLKEEANT